MGGPLWTNRERYIDNSPLLFLDRVHTPLLLVQGMDDPTTPSEDADRVFVALRRLGQEVEYVRYAGEGEGHDLRGYADQRDLCERLIRWFDFHLKSR